MNPSFFGDPSHQLLGVHEAPRAGARAHGVVLCGPAPHETARSHWALRKLSEQLTKVGFDVLRFDYRGTGDSSGELGQSSPALWVEDIALAARELKEVAGVRKLSAVGFRLGALLLAQAAGQGLALETLVLWEPVVSARAWLEALALIDTQQRRALRMAPPREPGELLGFVLPPALDAAWRALDLAQVPQWPAGHTAVVAAESSAQLERLRRALEQRGQAAGWHFTAPAGGTTQHGALLGNEALEKIVAVVGGAR